MCERVCEAAVGLCGSSERKRGGSLVSLCGVSPVVVCVVAPFSEIEVVSRWPKNLHRVKRRVDPVQRR